MSNFSQQSLMGATILLLTLILMSRMTSITPSTVKTKIKLLLIKLSRFLYTKKIKGHICSQHKVINKL